MRQKNAGRRISSVTKVQPHELRSPVQTLPISNGSLGPKILKYKHPTNVFRGRCGSYFEPLDDFCPRPGAQVLFLLSVVRRLLMIF